MPLLFFTKRRMPPVFLLWPHDTAHLMGQSRRCIVSKDEYQVDDTNMVGLCSIASLVMSNPANFAKHQVNLKVGPIIEKVNGYLWRFLCCVVISMPNYYGSANYLLRHYSISSCMLVHGRPPCDVCGLFFFNSDVASCPATLVARIILLLWHRCRTFLSILCGVVAGIWGFTGLTGFVFYFLIMMRT